MTRFKSPAPDPEAAIIAAFNARHAVANENGKTVVLTERRDPVLNRLVLDRSSVGDFRSRYANRLIGHRLTEADVWLRSPDRRQFEGIYFDPSGAPAVPSYLNLYRGLSVTPAEGDWQVFADHLFDVGAAGDEAIYTFILDWFAWLLQHPADMIQTAIVWRGVEGSGKGSIARILGSLYGQHFLHVTRVAHLVGQYTAHLQDALLVFSDEAFWAGDKQSEGAIKTLITEPILLIEGKYKQPVMARNFVHLVMATNHDWAVPVGVGNRRFAVIDVPDTHVRDTAYFNTLHHHMGNGGLPAFAWAMLHREVSSRPVLPDSDAARATQFIQQLYNMTPLEKFWHERLTLGVLTSKCTDVPWPEMVLTEDVYADYIGFSEKLNVTRRAAQTELGIKLHEWMPDLKKIRLGSIRAYYWRFPSLEACRDAWSRRWKVTIRWEDSDGDSSLPALP